MLNTSIIPRLSRLEMVPSTFPGQHYLSKPHPAPFSSSPRKARRIRRQRILLKGVPRTSVERSAWLLKIQKNLRQRATCRPIWTMDTLPRNVVQVLAHQLPYLGNLLVPTTPALDTIISSWRLEFGTKYIIEAQYRCLLDYYDRLWVEAMYIRTLNELSRPDAAQQKASLLELNCRFLGMIMSLLTTIERHPQTLVFAIDCATIREERVTKYSPNHPLKVIRPYLRQCEPASSDTPEDSD